MLKDKSPVLDSGQRLINLINQVKKGYAGDDTDTDFSNVVHLCNWMEHPFNSSRN